MKRNLILVVIIVITVASGVASLLLKLYPVAGTILVAVGLLVTVWQIISSELRNQYVAKMTEAQNAILAAQGLGNVYQKILEEELKKSGKSAEGVVYLRKAYELEPNNLNVIRMLSGAIAMNISFRRPSSRGIKADKNWRFAETLVKKGLEKNPRDSVLLDVLGILYDCAGEHEVARNWFRKSSKFRKDPYWHLMMATSWGMSGNDVKALDEMEVAIKEGARGWWVELNYGIALSKVGRCREALEHINSARREKGFHPGICEHTVVVKGILGEFSTRLVVDIVYMSLLYSKIAPVLGLKITARLVVCLLFTLLTVQARLICKLTSRVSVLCRASGNFFCAVSLAFTYGQEHLAKRDYEIANRFFEVCYSLCSMAVPILQNLSVIYAYSGNRKKAVELCTKALTLDPKNKVIRWNMNQFKSGLKLNLRHESSRDIKRYLTGR